MSENILDRVGSGLVDRLNPIVTKELRQSMKGRLFHIFFLIVIIVGTAVTLISSNLAEQNPAPDWGRDIFLWFVFGLNFLAIALVPMTAFMNVSMERDDRTLELVNISGLTPGQVIRGKILSTLVQAGLYISAILPFMAFTYFLGGIDVLSIAFVLLLQVLAAILCTTLAIAIATSIPSRALRLIIGGILALGLIGAAILGVPAAWEISRDQLAQKLLENWNEEGVQQAVAGLFLAYASVLALAYTIAVANTSFESANRSTPMRTVLLLQWLGYFALTTWVYLATERDYRTAWVFFMFFCVYWAGVGFFMLGERARLSRRTWRALELRSREVRTLISPLLPGVERAALYFAGVLVLSAVYTLALVELFPQAPGTGGFHRLDSVAACRFMVFTWTGYAATYVLVPWFLARMAGIRQGAGVRVFTLIFGALGLLAPLIGVLLFDRRQLDSSQEMMLFGSNPLWVMIELSNFRGFPWGLTAVVATIGGFGLFGTLLVGVQRLLPRGPEEDLA